MPKPNKFHKVLEELDVIDDATQNNTLTNLLKRTSKEKTYENVTTNCPTINYINQIDLLFLPADDSKIKGLSKQDKDDLKMINKVRAQKKEKPLKQLGEYKYCLVVVDIATGIIDCEPIRYKYSFLVRDGLKRIYARKILRKPHVIEVDNGSEFKNEFKTFFNANDTTIRYKKAGRHRAQSVVEAKNAIISKLIQTRMLNEELINQETSKQWAEDLPKIVATINKYYSHEPLKIDPLNPNVQPIKVKKNTVASIVLEIGTPVRIQLDNPINAIDEKRLHGKFRVGDIRWENKVRHITWIFLRPNQPPTYKVDDIDVAYTRQQLQVVANDEVKPVDKSNKKFIVEKIINKRKLNNRIEYLVKWQNYKDSENSWEPRTDLIKDIPDMIKDYEASI